MAWLLVNRGIHRELEISGARLMPGTIFEVITFAEVFNSVPPSQRTPLGKSGSVGEPFRPRFVLDDAVFSLTQVDWPQLMA